MAAILFDADGVLLDSMECYRTAWAQWGQVHGIEIELIWPLAPGRRPSEIVSLVAPELQQGSELLRFQGFLDETLAGVKAMPGADDLLAAMPESQWCIASSGHRSQLLAALRAAGLPAPLVVVAAEDVAHGKPSPDCYLLAAARLGTPPTECVVVEDAPVGIAAARAAGMRCIAVATTHSEGELVEADRTFASLASASDLILAWAHGCPT